MYARIAFDAGWISWNTSTVNIQSIAFDPLDEQVALHPQSLAAQWVDKVFERQPVSAGAANSAEEQQRVREAVRAMVPWLNATCLNDPDSFEFTVHCAIAHHRLPAPVRLARETRVATIRDSLVTDAPRLSDALGSRWDAFKTLGVLLPDVFLDSHLRNMVGQSVMACCLVAVARREPTPLSPLLAVLPLCTTSSAKPSEALFFQVMLRLYLSRALADRPALIELIKEMKRLKQYDWPNRAYKQLKVVDVANVTPVIQQDCLFSVLRDTLKENNETLRQEVLRFQLDQMIELQKAKTQQVVQLTIDAVLAGVPLGDAFTDQVKAALAAEERATDQALRDEDALRLHERQANPAGPGRASADRAAHDPVHTWSVARLAAWIEGPVTRQPIDRAKIAARERTLAGEREQRRARATAGAADGRADPGAADPTGPEPELAVEDINLAVDDALRTTAAFFRDDLTEMIALAKQLGVAPNLIRQAADQGEAMARLASPASVVQDEQARPLLEAAEAAIAQLRAAIKRSKTTLQQNMKFTGALFAALQKEPLERGRRQGGVIAHPMPLASWPWVFDTFHARWLHQQRRLLVDGHPVPLRSDQALALYVTGSSESGYAFDISVHLWQRRPGASSLPSVDTDGGLRMNTDDWFDTYTPCAVLHVRPAR